MMSKRGQEEFSKGKTLLITKRLRHTQTATTLPNDAAFSCISSLLPYLEEGLCTLYKILLYDLVGSSARQVGITQTKSCKEQYTRQNYMENANQIWSNLD